MAISSTREINLIQTTVTLGDLSDISAASPITGQVLEYTGAGWEAQTPPSPILDLDDIPNVDLTTVPPVVGEALVWDGVNWVPGDGGSVQMLDDLSDVTIDTLVNGQTLVYVAAQGKFFNVFLSSDNVVEGGTNLFYTDIRVDNKLTQTPINTIGNVDADGAVDGEALIYDGTTELWTHMPITLAELGDIENVDTTAKVNSDVLVWSSGLNLWVPGAPTARPVSLDDLTDVDVTTSSTGAVIEKQPSGLWTHINLNNRISTIASNLDDAQVIGDHDDVELAGLIDSQVLTWSTAMSKWVPTTLGAGLGPFAMDGLTDAYVPVTPTDGMFLKWDSLSPGSAWKSRFISSSDLTDSGSIAYQSDLKLENLLDVSIPAPIGLTPGEVLGWNGASWVNLSLPGGGDLLSTNNLADIGDAQTAATNLIDPSSTFNNTNLAWQSTYSSGSLPPADEHLGMIAWAPDLEKLMASLDPPEFDPDGPAFPLPPIDPPPAWFEVWTELSLAGIGDLPDVDLGGILPGQVLAYDHINEKFIPLDPAAASLGSINDLGDVDTTGLTDEDYLYYDSGTFTWRPRQLITDNISEGATNFYFTNTRFDTRFTTRPINDLVNVSIGAITTGQVLTWTGSTWTNDDPSVGDFKRTSVNDEAISTTKALLATDEKYQFLDCDGAGANTDVVLPPLPANEIDFVFVNTGATYSLVIKDASTPIITIGPGEEAKAAYDSVSGWLAGTLVTANPTATVPIEVNQENLLAAKVLLTTDDEYQFLNPDTNGADTDVVLPSAPSPALRFTIQNEGSTYNLVVKDGVTPVETLVSGSQTTFIYDSTPGAWVVLAGSAGTGGVGDGLATVNVETLSANKALADASETYQFLDPNGATRDVTLPVSPSTGRIFVIQNAGTADDLDIKQGLTSIEVISSGDQTSLLYDGTNWRIV